VERLSLRSDRLRAEIAPQGGSVTRLDLRSGDAVLPILHASDMAMHPLLPFANRIPGNVIDLVDPPLRLQPNVPGEACALHGIGWQREWRVVEVQEDRCTLELIVSPEEWVLGFRAVQAFSVAGGEFRATLEIENTSNRPIPAGLGFHPYFFRAPRMQLQFHAAQFWLEGPGYLPTDAISLPPELDFAAPAPLPEAWRNNCYSGWDGRATIHDPARGLEVMLRAGGPLRDLMLYTPPGAGYFCLEPQSHTTGAVTRARARPPATPLQILAPEERLAVDLTLAARRT
jgi:aldose 1-epimerase